MPIKIRILYNYCTMFSITNKLQERLPVWGYHLFGSDCTLIKFTSHHFNFCTFLWWWAYQILLNFMFKVYFSSPELTAQWSYCDNFLSGIRLSVCLSFCPTVFKLFTFLTSSQKPQGLFEPKFSQCILRWREFKFSKWRAMSSFKGI